MTRELSGIRRRTTPPLAEGRQLTVGECIAVARYGPHLVDKPGEPIPLEAVLDFLDRIRVCTTCGWPVHIHQSDPETRKALQSCAQHTRER